MKKALFAAAIAAFGFTGAAQAATLTFDSFSHGDVITSLNLGGGVTASVSANGNSSSAPDEAWVFDTMLDNTRDPDLEGPFTDDGVDYDIYTGAVLIVQENSHTPDDDGNGGWITFDFSKPISFLGFDFLDDETVTATDNNGNSTTIGTPRGRAFNNYFTSSGLLNWTNVTQLTFDFGHNSGAIDNLRYELAPVPLPASLVLLLGALGALGFARRRQTA